MTALLSAVGENKLMPGPDTSCLVINGASGYVRQNYSWTVARLVRDFDYWMDARIRTQLQAMLSRKWDENRAAATARCSAANPHAKAHCDASRAVPQPRQAGLCVSVYAAKAAHPAPPEPDPVYLSGLATPVVQLGIAAVPCGLYADWAVLAITGAGILMALATGLLPQWCREKWACRRQSDKRIVLTRGNGAQHAIVVLGEGTGLDLEDLAAGPANLDMSASYLTLASATVLSALWIALLITAAGLKEHTWFLVAVGGIGMLQNIFVAGARRTPEAVGVPLEFKEVICETKVLNTLLEVERKYPRLGRSMLDTFFPGGRFTQDELARWREVEAPEEGTLESESSSMRDGPRRI